MTSKISWTEQTWNPIVGCSKVSEGCRHCYAERMAKRLKAMGQKQYETVVDENGWTGKTALVKSALEKPYHWKKQRMVFVGSMTDIFHETVPDDWLFDIFNVMEDNSQHIFQVLTKRPDRMGDFLTVRRWAGVPDNVWLGVTAENQQAADERIPLLLSIDAKVRFVSVEPMLGPVNIDQYLNAPPCHENYKMSFSWQEILSLDWVICGGESGPGARPLSPNYVRELQAACQYYGTPFHFKQWGGVNKKKTGRELDGRVWDEFPQL